jgi:hypothetical protein
MLVPPVGFDSVAVKGSGPSKTLSSRIGTLKVFVVSPSPKESVPEAVVKSLPAVAVPEDVE